MKVFDKQKFKQHAPKNIQKILSKHLDALDGVEVTFVIIEPYGELHLWIPVYKFEGKSYELYPVDEEWCVELEVLE